jgi:hypothetical protein
MIRVLSVGAAAAFFCITILGAYQSVRAGTIPVPDIHLTQMQLPSVQGKRTPLPLCGGDPRCIEEDKRQQPAVPGLPPPDDRGTQPTPPPPGTSI